MDLRTQIARMQALFEEALTYPEGEARDAFLLSACGPDTELLLAVERILGGHERVSAVKPGGELLPRFGAYQAVRLIGRGGMGAVYLAERADGEFHMQVAVKVIAGLFLSPILEESFRRERQILAGLNHPNIARLLDGGVQDGAPYLVMEYVDGVRLDEYCAERELDTDGRLGLLITVCRAVEYAHTGRVVHRDLKPSNILVTGMGEVKLLDFGSSQLLESRTVPGQSVTGMRSFTPDYSSPELREGRVTGTAADVFSLGVLLGKLCPGNVAAQKIAARATEWEPTRRHASVAALREELERCGTSSRPALLRNSAGWALGIAAALVILLLSSWWRLGSSVVADDDLYIRLSPEGTRWRDASLSADGQWLAYSSDQAHPGNYDIWLRRLDEEGAGRRLTAGPERDMEPSVSPDGRFVVFYSNRQPAGIYRVEASTGRTELLAAGGRTPKYSPDGQWIAYAGSARYAADPEAANPLHQVRLIPAQGGQAVEVSAGLPAADLPVWKTDSSELLFIGYPGRNVEEFWQVPIRNGSIGTRQLPANGAARGLLSKPCAFNVDGGTAYTMDSSKAFDRALVVMRQAASPALRDPLPRRFEGAIRNCSLASDGSMVVEGMENRTSFWVQPLNPDTGMLQGALHRSAVRDAGRSAPALSWDGRWMAYRSSSDAIWLDDLQTGERLTYPNTEAPAGVTLSGDGQVLWSTETGGAIAAKRRNGGRLVRDDNAVVANLIWSANRDGRRLLAVAPNGPMRGIALMDTETRQNTTILSHPEWNLYVANLSPDDRWIVFEAETTDGAMVYAAPFRDREAIPVQDWILLGPGDDPKWSADGQAVFVLSYADGYACVGRIAVDALTKRALGPVEPWVHFHGLLTPRFLEPGYFRIAAAVDKIVVPLGERDEIVWLRRPKRQR